MSVFPFVPPRSVDLPPAGGVIGPKPEHFVVEEIPAYALSGEGEHVFLWVEKRGLTTPEVAKRIARAASARERDVGYAGLKDKNAVTRQWFSLCTKDPNPSAWELGEGASIIKATRHQNKLRTGHLHGNRFTITLVGATEGAKARAEAVAEALTTNGLVNYFGPQRFGFEGRNLARALEWLNTAGPVANSGDDAARQKESELPVEGKRRRSRKKPGGRFENKMLPSVLQSEIFNRYASARVQMPDELLLGEVVRLNDAGKHFVVEELEKELPRFRAGDLHLTGPMIGPKTLCGQHAAQALEHKIESELGLSAAQIELLGHEAPGARRDLFLYPEALAVESSGDDELAISFSLPSGSYATQIIREFTGADWESPRG